MPGAANKHNSIAVLGEPAPPAQVPRRAIPTAAAPTIGAAGEAAAREEEEEDAVVEVAAGEAETSPGLRARRKLRRRGGIKRRIREREQIIIEEMRGLGRWPVVDSLDEAGDRHGDYSFLAYLSSYLMMAGGNICLHFSESSKEYKDINNKSQIRKHLHRTNRLIRYVRVANRLPLFLPKFPGIPSLLANFTLTFHSAVTEKWQRYLVSQRRNTPF